jgi:hypothetical protein
MIPKDQKYHRILAKLHSFRKAEKRIHLLTSLFFVLFSGICIFLSLITFESAFWLTPSWKWPLLLVTGSGFLFILVKFPGRWIYSYWFQPDQPSDDSIAERIGQEFPVIHDRLINAIQVFRLQNQEENRASPNLAQSAIEHVYEITEQLDFNAAVSQKIFRVSFRLFVSVILSALCLSILFHSAFLPALFRWCHPNCFFERPVPYSLRFKPGSLCVIEGDSLLLTVEGEERMPSEITLVLNDGGSRETKKIQLHRPFRYRIATIRNSFKYSYSFEHYQSKTFTIEVHKRPELISLHIVVHPPAYTGLTTRIYEKNVGHIEGLKTSRVEIRIKSDKRNTKVNMVFQSGKRIGLISKGLEASGHFFIDRDDLYWIEIQDQLGVLNDHPVRYIVRMLRDLMPTAIILSPASSSELDQSMTIPLVLKGDDDFGIQKAQLGYCVESPPSEAGSAHDTAYFELHLPKPSSSHLLLSHPWRIEPLNLLPEDIVHYFFEVEDNDALNGSKHGRSAIQSFRFPSILEIVQKFETEQNQQIQTLDSVMAENQEALKDLDQLSEDLKTARTVPWERKKELLNGVENLKKDQEKLQNLSDRYDLMAEKIRENDQVGIETLKKYEELQKLIKDLASPEINALMTKMLDALNQADPETLKEATEEMKISQEDVLEALDRTIALFKGLQAEQKVEQLINQLSEMMKKQIEITSGLNKNSIQDRQSEARKEQKLDRESEDFQKEAGELSMSASGIPDFPGDLFRSFVDSLMEERLPDLLQRLAENIQNGSLEGGASQGEKAVHSMERLKKILENVKGQMHSRQKNKELATLKKTSLLLLNLSRQQEMVMMEVKEGRLTDVQVTGEQNAILSGIQQMADTLYHLSRENFSVPPSLGHAIGEAKDNMKKSMVYLEAGDRSGTIQSQSKSMGALNRSVVEIQDAMSKSKGENSGNGMEDLFEEMEQIGQEQMALNQKLMQMMEQGRLSLESQAGISRLGTEQQSLRQRTEQLLQKYQAHTGLQGDLGGITEEMDKVTQELLREKVDDGTLRRQAHILSRMLDSQRALKQEDEGSRRRAKAGMDVERKSTARISGEKSSESEWLQNRLFELSNDGFSDEYRKWIRRYYERLAKENR